MISSWRRKRASRVAGSRGVGAVGSPTELIIPNHFRCPISLDLMKDPVTLSTGITYDRESIEKWIEGGNITCPMTNQVLRTLEPVPNHTIRRMIQDWCVENRSHGVERIPTPRVPVSSDEVIEILESISMAKGTKECREIVGKVSRIMKESERNRRCMVASGVGRSMSSIFQFFSEGENESEDTILLLEDIMIVLTSMFPLDLEAENNLKTTHSLGRLVWFLKHGSLSGRRNSSLILKQLVSSSKDQEKVVDTLLTIEGAIEGLVNLIKNPICPSSTKASLVIIYQMITHPSKEGLLSRLLEMGLVSIILDILVDSEKSTCEKALGVLDAICNYAIGREAAYNHALTVPVVVKKILRISDLATEFSVSILWRLSENEKRENGGVVVEALQVGAFQKLLLILQVGWNTNERTKEKVTKLLKILNLYRDRVECIESMDFKNLKRSF